MTFTKIAGKIADVKFNKTEQQAIDAAVAKRVVEVDRQFELDHDSNMLWMLHVHFGFGPKKLFKAWSLINAENKKLQEKYEMGPEDGGWLCRQQLKAYGVDLERWYKDAGLS